MDEAENAKQGVFGSPGTGLVDLQGAGAVLGVPPRLVRELWQRRELAGIKIGRRVRFSREDLDDYVRRHRVEANR
jgi:excisionase family DNA binding protein